MKFLLFILILILAIFEGSVTTIPLTLVFLSALYVWYDIDIVLLFAFLSGIIIDMITLKFIGMTSIFFVTFVFILSLYGKKFETKTIQFAISSAFFGSLFYLIIFKYSYPVQQAMVSSIIAIVLFIVFSRINNKKLLNC